MTSLFDTSNDRISRRPAADGSALPRLQRKRRFHTAILAALLIAVLPFQQSSWPGHSPLHEGMEALSYLLLIACVLGRIWCAAYIGGRKKRELVAEGPYSVVRNPLYLFSFLGTLGIGLASASLLLTLFLGLAFALYYRDVVQREEALLVESFGADFESYRSSVPRWLPDLRRWREAEGARVEPRFVFLTLRDSALFFAALPAFELVEYLQAGGLLPVLWRLP